MIDVGLCPKLPALHLRTQNFTENITQFINARSAQVRLQKAHNERVTVLIAACVIPAVVAVVGAGLHHAERCECFSVI